MSTQLSTVREDKANEKKFRLDPALVDAIHDDPAAVQGPARVMAATLLHEQFVESQSYTPAQKLALTETLAKLGAMEPKKLADQQQGGGVTISINIPALDGASSRNLTIDQKTETSDAVFSLPITVPAHPEFEVVDE